MFARSVLSNSRSSLIGLAILSLAACGSASQRAAVTSVVQPGTGIDVATPKGLSVDPQGTTAVVHWAAPAGLKAPLTGYQFYLDQKPMVSLGPQVTSRKLTGLSSGSHYVQVVALAAHNQSIPAADTFEIAYADPVASSTPVPAPVATPSLAPIEVPSTVPTEAPSPVATQVPSPVATQAPSTISAAEACTTILPDFTTALNDATDVLNGVGDPVTTGHEYGSIIVELEDVSQTVSDSHLAGMISTVTSDMVSMRNVMLNGGSPTDVPAGLSFANDTTPAADYCGSLGDPLAS